MYGHGPGRDTAILAPGPQFLGPMGQAVSQMATNIRAYTIMAFIVMVYIVMAYIVMAYITMACIIDCRISADLKLPYGMAAELSCL